MQLQQKLASRQTEQVKAFPASTDKERERRRSGNRIRGSGFGSPECKHPPPPLYPSSPPRPSAPKRERWRKEERPLLKMNTVQHTYTTQHTRTESE